MGAYITQADISNSYGIANVCKWSNVDGTTTTVNLARIATAIAVAENHVENRFRGGKYAIPFVALSFPLYVVKDWCAKLAGIWLYEHRGLWDANDEGNLLEDMRKRVENEMDKYLAGEAQFDAQLATAGSPSAPVALR